MISVMTAADGSYVFEDIPVGTHVLWVWGGTSFLNVTPTSANKGVFLSEIIVEPGGDLRGIVPPQVLIAEKPLGVLGFPVRSGAGAFRVFEGSVNVRQALAARAASLPGAGDGGRHASLRWVALASGIALLAGAAISWAGARGRRRS